MRPEFLAFEAFGSYRGRAEIDFRTLGGNGVFLICGQTGGGKTTILDAMSVALYGRATGSLRGDKWRLFRCENADPSADTVVDFIFSTGGQRWRFFRRWRITKKGEGELKEIETACFSDDGNGGWVPAFTGTQRALGSEAERILGLSHEQFVKVICLPQGEFRKLLTSGSQERTKIFEQLFGTFRWKKTAEAASREVLDIETGVRSLNDRIAGLLTAAGAESATALEILCDDAVKQRDAMKKSLDDMTAQLDRAEKALAGAVTLGETYAQLDKLREKLASLEAQREEMAALSARLERHSVLAELLPQYEALCETKKLLLERSERLTECAEAAKKAATEFSAAAAEYGCVGELTEKNNALHEELALLRSVRQKADELGRCEKDISDLGEKIKDADDGIKDCADAIEDANRRVETGQKYVRGCDEAIEQLPTAVAENAEAAKKVELYEKLDETDKKLTDAKKQRDKAASGAKEAAACLEDERTALEALRRMREANAAFALSHTLENGRPCPVCGSTEHPCPAQSADAPDAEMIARAEKRAADAQVENDRRLTVLSDREAAFRLAQEQYDAQRSSCKECGLSREEAAAGLENAKKRLEELELQRSRRPAYAERLSKLTEQLTNEQKKLEELKTRRAELAAELSAAAARRDALSGELAAGTEVGELDKRIAALEESCLATGNAIGSITDRYNNCRVRMEKTASERDVVETTWRETGERAARLTDEYAAACAERSVEPDCDVRAGMMSDGEFSDGQKRLGSYTAGLELTRVSIRQHETDLEGTERPRTDELRDIRDALKEKSQKLAGEHGEASGHAGHLVSVMEQVSSARAEIAAKTVGYSELKRISEYLNGQNPKKTPIDQFVAGLLLDEVIEAANCYWTRLSRGQYTLRRSDTVKGKERYQGVNFEVVDAHIGGVRAIETLSGGELFLASLSLAFGLSDVVQGFSGGMRLDSVFIDEGFGSLDHDTLDIVMNALSDIREGRMIGIISHVDDLRVRIGSRIEVSKTDVGSSLRVVV